MRKESISSPAWVRRWERNQRGPWPKFPPLPRGTVEGHKPFSLAELIISILILLILAGLVARGVAAFRRAGQEAERAALQVQGP